MEDSAMPEGLTARDFLERELRANPEASFAELQDRGRQLGLNIPPFLYGSARRALGLPVRRDLANPSPAVSVEPAPMPTFEAAAFEAADAVEPDAPAEVEDAEEMESEEAPADEAASMAAPMAGMAKAKSPAFDFAIEQLRINPDLSFQDLKQRGTMAGLRLMPIVYGRAKALLGLVPVKPRQPRAKKMPEAPLSLRQVESAEAMPRPMPRPAAQPAQTSLSLGSLEQLVTALRELESERQRLRAALAAIQACVDEAIENPTEG